MSTPQSITIHENDHMDTVPAGSSTPFDVDALLAGWWDDDAAGIERRMARRPLPCVIDPRDRGAAVTTRFRERRSRT